MVQSFRDLEVWRKSMDLAVEIYGSSEAFPSSDRFGLTSQMRRAAVSVASNIAEGKAIGGQGYRRHIKIALGSNAELQTQIELAQRLCRFPDQTATDLLQRAAEVGRMLAGLLKALPTD
jgi:four helix bundle protein